MSPHLNLIRDDPNSIEWRLDRILHKKAVSHTCREREREREREKGRGREGERERREREGEKGEREGGREREQHYYIAYSSTSIKIIRFL